MSFMDINLMGQAFSDYELTDMGVTAYQLEHDWFTKEDLEIWTNVSKSGTQLIDGVDYSLSEKNEELSERVTVAVGLTRTVYHKVQIINVTYQTGDLYHSGKYIADSNSAADMNVIQYKGVVANKVDLPNDVSKVEQGDMYMVMAGGPGSGGNMFVYMSVPYPEFGGWFDLDRARFCDFRWRGLAGSWVTAAHWIKNVVPGTNDRVAVTASELRYDVSTTIIDFLLGLCTFWTAGTRDMTIKGGLMCWPTDMTSGVLRMVMSAGFGRDVYMCEGWWDGQFEMISTTYNVYMSGNLFIIGSATMPPIIWFSGKLWVNGHIIHWIGDTGTEQTITLTAAGFDNQTAGGEIRLRGKLGLYTSNHDLEDVRLRDLSSSTYIKQYTNCTVGVLTIDANCTWDRNGFTLTYDSLINNGTLI